MLHRVPLDRGTWSPGDTLLGYMAASPGSVWVPRPEAGFVDRIDAASGGVSSLTRIPIDAFPLPDGAAWYRGSVWVGSLQVGKLARIDPDTHEVTVASLDVPTIGHNCAWSEEALWILDSSSGRVLRVEAMAGPTAGPSPTIVRVPDVRRTHGR